MGVRGLGRKAHAPKHKQSSSSTLLRFLSPKRQELIRPVLEHPRGYVLLSVRGLARKLGADPATTIRIVQGMGFASFQEFQRYLHELSILHATSLERMQTSSARDSNIPAHMQETLERNLKNLQILRHSLDFQRVAALARRIYKARRILLLGGDLAASLITYLEYHLSVLGLNAVSASTPGAVAHKVRNVGKGDLVVAISYRRGLRQTVEGLQQARANGAYGVGITDTYVSPIARFADEFFLTSVETTSFGASYVAPMAFLETLLVACANYRRGRTLAHLKEVDEEQRHGFRWYQES